MVALTTAVWHIGCMVTMTVSTRKVVMCTFALISDDLCLHLFLHVELWELYSG